MPSFLTQMPIDILFFDVVDNIEIEKGRKLCIHHRDFVIGCDIADNITNSIHQSRKVVCLISRAFIKYKWCIYELNISHVESLWSRGGDNIVIIVQIDDLLARDLPIRVIEMIRDETYTDRLTFYKHVYQSA